MQKRAPILLIAIALVILGNFFFPGIPLQSSLQSQSPSSLIKPKEKFEHSHALLDKILKKHVKEGLVNYQALQAAPQDLKAYLFLLASVTQTEFDRWSEEQQLAYLINLYNAATLKLIIDHYPIKSIKKIGNFFKGPWDRPFVDFLGETITLNHLEHDIIRARYKEPRIHFALVCAAKGCPSLRAEAYTPERLQAQLEDQTKVFLTNKQKNYLDKKKKVLYLSRIFKWYKEDFVEKSPSLIAYVTPYFSAEEKGKLTQGKYRVKYTQYDWSLNVIE